MEAVTSPMVSDKKVSDKELSAKGLSGIKTSKPNQNTIPHHSSSYPLPEGTVLLDRYMLMRVIAQGGASYIYRARDMLAVLGGNEAQSHIAVKIILNNKESVDENHQLVLHEALTTRHLSHQHIIKVFDYHRDGDISFVTMELVEGESLAEYIQRLPEKKLPYRFAISILKAVGAALQAAHDQGVVHSDIKPSNILKTESGDVKVIDFATARTLIEKSHHISEPLNNYSGKGASFYGYTLAYASPETILDKPASASDDVFSFACIVYEILAGKHPYGRKPTNTIDQNYRLIKPREIGFWQWQVLKKALQLKGSERTASVKTFMRLFHHTRYAWSYLALAITLALGVSILGVWGVDKIGQTNIESTKYSAFYRQEQNFQSTMNELERLPPLEQLEKVYLLKDYSKIQQASGKSQLREVIIQALSSRVRDTIATVTPLEAINEFNVLSALLQKAKLLYPDSLSLENTLALLESESSQLRDTNVFALSQAWSRTDFSQYSAEEIKGLIELLERSGSQADTLQPDRIIVEQYQSSVLKAVKDLDVINVSKLYEFSLAFESVDKFRNVWRSVDKAYAIGAQDWIDFSLSGRNYQEYPRLTMQYYVLPYFKNLNDQIKTVWTDKDLIRLKNDLINGIDKYALSDELPIVKTTNNFLISKIENKIKYYQNKGNRKGVGQLDGLLSKLKL
ncbi:MAG: serine/threonine-protein kinase [Cellvibrionaceae bacterium]